MTTKELLVLSGMSGAGRSTVAHSLEDLGWYVVDNLPPALLPQLAEQALDTHASLAVVVDVRGGKFFDELSSALAALKAQAVPYRLLFLDASDSALVQRFESTRRPGHPPNSAGYTKAPVHRYLGSADYSLWMDLRRPKGNP
jgi:UPF0042 nucleotide-binding protein